MNTASILVVDDSPIVCMAISLVLGSIEGVVVESTGSMSEAREKLASQTYQFVLLDRRLGADDGLDLIPVVRRTQPSAKIALIGDEAIECEDVDQVCRKDANFESLKIYIEDAVRASAAPGEAE